MKKLPLFPLNIVAYPGENVNLHVFEPRYKQLINDCLRENGTFGIPSFVLNKIELGTEVEILDVTKKYDDGRLDIQTRALKVFRVKDFWNPWGEKLYAGGEIDYLPESESIADEDLLFEFKELCNQLFGWLSEVDIPNLALVDSAYDVAHKIGLKPDEEYRLLEMKDESERLQYAIEHLKRLIPALERAQTAQDRIKQNGHFKHLDPLEF